MVRIRSEQAVMMGGLSGFIGVQFGAYYCRVSGIFFTR